jgi:hypothetical protein
VKRIDVDRSGLTLVELVLAVGLASLLFAALLSLLDTSMTIWDRTESQRDRVEVASAVGELLDRDLAALEGGPRGDLLADWTMLDGDGDGRNGAPYPRIRMVRRVTAAELQRLQAGSDDPARGEGLLEVTWALVPIAVQTPRREVHRVLWRGARLVGDEETLSHFDDRFFDELGRAVPGALDEVASGVLWFGIAFATQTTRFDGGWTTGPELRDAARSWDAWALERPDGDEHAFNDPGAGMPEPDGLALLPRRVRVELELERPADRKKRTTLRSQLDEQSVLLSVDDGERLPEDVRYVLVDEEWMLVRSVVGNEVTVQRGARGTIALPHEPGAIVHHGHTIVREVPVPAYREDWNL